MLFRDRCHAPLIARVATGALAAALLSALAPSASAAAREPGDPAKRAELLIPSLDRLLGARPDPFEARHLARRLSKPAVTSHRLIIAVTPGSSPEAVASRIAAAGASGVRHSSSTRTLSVAVKVAEIETLGAALRRVPGVESVRPAARYRLADVPAEPRYLSAQRTYFQAVAAEPAWDLSSGDGVRVAVLDSGIDDTHPELAGRVVGRYNAVTGTEDASDQVGHGTAVASVLAANVNGSGMAGAAREAHLLAVKVEDDAGGIYSDALADGIHWAIAQKAGVINLSLGGPEPDDLLGDALAAARAAGIVIVASAGNGDPDTGMGNTDVQYPAAYPGVIAVGATTADGTARTSWSTYGSWVSVAAPGESILAVVPVGMDDQDGSQDGFAHVRGTSFSAPLVAAEAALARSRNRFVSGAEIERVVLGAHDGKQLGFARGNVSFVGALNALPPPSAPSVSKPVSGSTVSGITSVSVSSTSAGRVRFSLRGAEVTSSVQSGVASGELPTWGLTGSQVVRAVSCSSTACGSAPADVAVNVSNPAPVLTGPAAGSTVDKALTISATAAGGGVAFLVDGKRVAFDGVAPYSRAVSTVNLADGSHSVGALQCNSAGTSCDTAHPAPARTITVKRLRPTLAVSPAVFSPNRDGQRDLSVLTYVLEQTQTVDLRISTPAGDVVRSGRLGTNKVKGSYAWAWDGRNNAGNLVADGTYHVVIDTSVTSGGTTIRGAASRAVWVDRQRPALSALGASSTTVYPVVDGYRDTIDLAVTINEPVGALYAEVFNSAGSRVRVLKAGSQPAGRRALTWNGRNDSSAVVPAGSYTYRFRVQDAAGNVTVSAKAPVSASMKKLVGRTGTASLTPHASRTELFIAPCSAIARSARTGWTDSYGYYSDYYYFTQGCYTESTLAAARHSYTLPGAIRYGSVKVSAYGGAWRPGSPDTAELIYFDRYGDLVDASVHLGAADGSRTGPTVSVASLAQGRTVSWLAGTVGGRWYDVKSFTVTYTYYVLA